MSDLFPRRNISNSALVDLILARFLFMTPDATLNPHSEGADDAGMERIFCASNQTLGNRVQFAFYHDNRQRKLPSPSYRSHPFSFS
jgi:hypothetical protein